MTQTINSCNEVLQEKTYPLDHLRNAESVAQLCELVDLGHPISDAHGSEVHYLMRLSLSRFSFHTVYHEHMSGYTTEQENLLNFIKLAPITYFNSQPVHVGDDVVMRFLEFEYPLMTVDKRTVQALMDKRFKLQSHTEKSPQNDANRNT